MLLFAAKVRMPLEGPVAFPDRGVELYSAPRLAELVVIADKTEPAYVHALRMRAGAHVTCK